jgi:hypothetical protein
MRNKIENIKRRIAQPYIDEATNKVTKRLVNYFVDTRQLDLERLVKRLDTIRYDKPWPKGTTLDEAFDLAVYEAEQIVREELRK